MRLFERYGRTSGRASRPAPAALLPTLLLVAACAHGPPSTAAPQPPDSALAEAAVRATAPDGPTQAVFTWKLQERDARLGGRAVARIDTDRARLDLFGPRGESYLAAVAVGQELRLPPGVDPDLVPPPALLWSALGVFVPPADARLAATRGDSSHLELRYEGDSGSWTFTLDDMTLVSARWQPRDGGRHTVELQRAAGSGLPTQARYRDYLAFRELDLNLDDVKHVPGFPAEIWSPGGP